MNRIILLCIAGAVLGGCAHGGGCDGFEPQRPKSGTVDYLYQHDPDFADSVLAHNLHGQRACGWTAR